MPRIAATQETAAEKKNQQVNATIPTELYNALDEHRWEARIDRFPKLVARALEEYAVNHGLVTVATEESATAEESK